MKIPSMIANNPVLIGGVLIVGIAALWLATRGAKQTGKDIGGGAIDLVFGTVSGAGNAVVDNLNDPDTNPLYNVGSIIGTTIFDWTHKS